MSGNLSIKGLPELLKKLDTVRAARFLRGALQAAAEMVRNRVNLYPPSTEANLPGGPTGRWYERGYGPRWIRKRTGGVGGRKTSQMLGRSWYAEMAGMTAKVGNRASYAKFVQGRDDQAGIHRARGWVTLEDAADQELPKIEQLIQREVDRQLNS